MALTQKLWQNTGYLHLHGMSNEVMTISAHHFNICHPKFGEMMAHFAPIWLRAWQQ